MASRFAKRTHRAIWKAEEEPQAAETADTGATNRRARFQVLIALICACGVFYGIHLSRPKTTPLTLDRALSGTWELVSVAKEPVGPKTPSAILSQRMTLREGKIEGETRLHSDSAAATTSMPFPDESVEKVQVTENEVQVSWKGTYELQDKGQLLLRIGKAIYHLKVQWNPAAMTLELDHDAILLYPGASVYRVSTNRFQETASKR